ncbi:hypothetical protein ERJ75_001044200 [Trypanosoma vivax]|nr:hypothetical protein ERJ75_001044200 [Trypanosoma vivax]
MLVGALSTDKSPSRYQHTQFSERINTRGGSICCNVSNLSRDAIGAASASTGNVTHGIPSSLSLVPECLLSGSRSTRETKVAGLTHVEGDCDGGGEWKTHGCAKAGKPSCRHNASSLTEDASWRVFSRTQSAARPSVTHSGGNRSNTYTGSGGAERGWPSSVSGCYTANDVKKCEARKFSTEHDRASVETGEESIKFTSPAFSPRQAPTSLSRTRRAVFLNESDLHDGANVKKCSVSSILNSLSSRARAIVSGSCRRSNSAVVSGGSGNRSNLDAVPEFAAWKNKGSEAVDQHISSPLEFEKFNRNHTASAKMPMEHRADNVAHVRCVQSASCSRLLLRQGVCSPEPILRKRQEERLREGGSTTGASVGLLTRQRTASGEGVAVLCTQGHAALAASPVRCTTEGAREGLSLRQRRSYVGEAVGISGQKPFIRSGWRGLQDGQFSGDVMPSLAARSERVFLDVVQSCSGRHSDRDRVRPGVKSLGCSSSSSSLETAFDAGAPHGVGDRGRGKVVAPMGDTTRDNALHAAHRHLQSDDVRVSAAANSSVSSILSRAAALLSVGPRTNSAASWPVHSGVEMEDASAVTSHCNKGSHVNKKEKRFHHSKHDGAVRTETVSVSGHALKDKCCEEEVVSQSEKTKGRVNGRRSRHSDDMIFRSTVAPASRRCLTGEDGVKLAKRLDAAVATLERMKHALEKRHVHDGQTLQNVVGTTVHITNGGCTADSVATSSVLRPNHVVEVNGGFLAETEGERRLGKMTRKSYQQWPCHGHLYHWEELSGGFRECCEPSAVAEVQTRSDTRVANASQVGGAVSNLTSSSGGGHVVPSTPTLSVVHFSSGAIWTMMSTMTTMKQTTLGRTRGGSFLTTGAAPRSSPVPRPLCRR